MQYVCVCVRVYLGEMKMRNLVAQSSSYTCLKICHNFIHLQLIANSCTELTFSSANIAIHVNSSSVKVLILKVLSAMQKT